MNNSNTNYALQAMALGKGLNVSREQLVRYLTESGVNISRINKVISTGFAWHQKDVTGLTSFKLFSGAAAAGETNQPQGFVRPDNGHFIILGMQVFQGNDATYTVGQTVWSPGLSNAELLSGYFSLYSNGQLQLDDVPMAVFTEVAEQRESGVLPFAEPIVWAGDTKISFEFTNEVAITATTATPIAVNLFGIELVS